MISSKNREVSRTIAVATPTATIAKERWLQWQTDFGRFASVYLPKGKIRTDFLFPAQESTNPEKDGHLSYIRTRN